MRGQGIFIFMLAVLAAAPARADDAETLRRMIEQSGATVSAPKAASDEPLRLSPDSATVLHLPEDAASVIVTNPAHASVVLDSPRVLIVMPRAPGATSFTVLSSGGKTILERQVVVASTAKPKYVRVRRSCTPGDAACVANAYYYCPDGCYEVTPVTGESQGAAPPAPGGGGAAPSVLDQQEPAPEPPLVNGEPTRPVTP